MREIGDILRAAREEKGLTVDDLYQRTRIRARLIQALEDGDISRVPGGMVYVKGFLRALCEELGLDYADLAGMLVEKPAATAAPVRRNLAANRRRRRSFAAVVLLLISLMVLGGLYMLWRDRVPAVVPPDTHIPPAQSTASEPNAPTPEPPEPLPEPAPALALVSESGERRVYQVAPWPMELTIVVERESCWFRVSAGGVQLASTTLQAGRSATFTSESEITLRLGNPGAVTLTINGIRITALPERLRDYVFQPVSP